MFDFATKATTRAELVVPLIQSGRVIGVIDLDSPTPHRFDAVDAAGLERLAALIAPLICP